MLALAMLLCAWQGMTGCELDSFMDPSRTGRFETYPTSINVLDRIEGQVWREFGPRLLRTVWFPAWNSHDYRSLLSNEDVKDVQVKRTGRFCKKVGKGIWEAITLQWLF